MTSRLPTPPATALARWIIPGLFTQAATAAAEHDAIVDRVRAWFRFAADISDADADAAAQRVCAQAHALDCYLGLDPVAAHAEAFAQAQKIARRER